MKQIILTSVLLLSFIYLQGQYQTDSIVIKKTFGTIFQKNGNNLTPGQLLDITFPNTEAYAEMKLAKSNYDVGYVFGFAGGFLIGWPIGTAIGGGDPNWTLAAVGAGLAVISIPFTISYTKHAKNAVHIYNKGLKYSYFAKPDLKIELIYNGIGIQIKF
jgi:hypothetical protein